MARLQGFNPDESRNPDTQRARAPRRINNPFAFAFHRNGYRVQGDKEGKNLKVRPDLIKIPIVGGAHGVTTRQDGKGNVVGFNPVELDADLKRRQLSRLPFSAVMPSIKAGSYCIGDEDRPGVYIEFVEDLLPGGEITRDQDLWLDWLDWLMAEKHVPPCPKHVLEGLRAATRTSLAAAENIALRNPGHKRRVDELKGELAAIEGEIKAQGSNTDDSEPGSRGSGLTDEGAEAGLVEKDPPAAAGKAKAATKGKG